MALQYRGIDIMGWTKDYLDNPFSEASITAHISALVRDFPSITHIAVAIPMNTNAEALSARGSNFGIDPATYATRFVSQIHAQGKKVIWRGTDCYFEGIYSFSKASLSNGNRFNVLGDDVTDTFDSSNTRNHGYGLTSAGGNLSSHYLTSHQSSNTWAITSDVLVGPTASGWNRTCLFNAVLSDVTMVAKVKKVGNQMIVVRASTDSNFPGYGLQMRDTNVLRIERPGLENLGEVSKTWVSGNWYWLKLQAIGTAIKGKAWADGDSEPGTWDIEITNATYGSGYCGFGGESNNGQFDNMTFTPEVKTNTWLYRAYNWINTNVSMFADGDMLVPYPEASGHQTLTSGGTYNQFFIDLKYLMEKIGTDNGKTFVSGYFSHLFTAALQSAYNSQYTDAQMATYDHYGTALGLGKRFPSYSEANSGAASTYTCPTSITEDANNREDFYPEKVAYNESIDVWVVSKGTGDLIMTIHDGSNNPVQMPSNQDLSDLSESYQVTIPNASLVEGAMNTFSVDWWNPNPDVQYHFHLTSTNGDTTVATVTSGNLNTVRNRAYKANANADALEIDIRNAYAKTGVPQFLQEWGDYWSTDSSLSSPTRDQTQHETYLTSIYAALQRLVDDGILVGFNYWRAIGGHEAVYGVSGDNTDPDNYSRTYEGDVLNTFFAANADIVSPPLLTVNETNPRYFDNGNGKALILTGTHNQNTLQDQGTSDPPSSFNFSNFLTLLVNNGHNFTRGWVTTTPQWYENSSDQFIVPLPWARTGPGNAADGKLKFDLTSFNQDYFDQIRARIIAAGEQGIYVSVMFFQGWSVNEFDVGSNVWDYHPFNAANNINSIDGDADEDGAGEDIQTLNIPAVTALQEAYVEEVIDQLNDLDNIIWEIVNEPLTGSAAFQAHMVDYIKTYEATKPKQHLVWFTPPLAGGDWSSQLASNADIVSPHQNDGFGTPAIVDGTKVSIWDSDHMSIGIDGDADDMWKAFTRGHSPIFLDTLPGSPGSTTLAARANMGYILSYANAMDLVNMTPSSTLASSGFCLAKASTVGEYLVYVPSGSSVTVDLSNTSGEMTVEWLRVSDGDVTNPSNITAGSSEQSISNPYAAAAVLYLKSVAVEPPAPELVINYPRMRATTRYNFATPRKVNIVHRQLRG